VKPPPFLYARPDTIDAACVLLASDEDAKVLAGGQSLVPLLNFRLARPSLLVDVSAIPELGGIRHDNGSLVIGAAVRQHEAERSALIAEEYPLIGRALHHVGHVPTRSRGTVGGSIAHADPAAELPAVAVAVDAELRIRGPRGMRSVSAESFFQGPFTADLEHDELLVDVALPTDKWDRSGFVELARRSGDFALAGAAAALRFSSADDGRIDDVRIVGLGPTPVRLRDAEDELRGGAGAGDAIARAARAAAAGCRPPSDVHADAEYRRRLIEVLVARVLEEVTG
jgi:carbon-monoxide dehydrogenase medium subunit